MYLSQVKSLSIAFAKGTLDMTSLILNLALSWTAVVSPALGDVLPPPIRYQCRGHLWVPELNQSIALRRSEKAVRQLEIEEIESSVSEDGSVMTEEKEQPALRLESTYTLNVAKKEETPRLHVLKTEPIDVNQDIAMQIYNAHQNCMKGK